MCREAVLPFINQSTVAVLAVWWILLNGKVNRQRKEKSSLLGDLFIKEVCKTSKYEIMIVDIIVVESYMLILKLNVFSFSYTDLC